MEWQFFYTISRKIGYRTVSFPLSRSKLVILEELKNVFKTWLIRYPWPRKVICDNGSEFKLHFMTLLKDFDIKPKPTTMENPQGNSPVERIHQVVQNMIKTKELDTFVFWLYWPLGWSLEFSSMGNTSFVPLHPTIHTVTTSVRQRHVVQN